MRILILVSIFFFPLSSYSAWKEVDCSSINKKIDFLNINYPLQTCWQSFTDAGAVINYAGEFGDFENYIWIDMSEITVGNSRWANDWAFQELKDNRIKDIIDLYKLGTSPTIDNKTSKLKSRNGKLIYYYKNFETSDGKGIVGGNTIDKLVYKFGIFTIDKNANLNENFISEILSSVKLSWANKGEQTSIKISNNSDTSSSTQEITDTLAQQGTVNNESFTGQRTFMLSWENVGVMQGTLSFDEQERTGRIDFKLPNDNSNCFGTYALSEVKGSWSFLCSNDSSASGSLQWNPSDNSIIGNGKDDKNNTVQVMVAGS